MSARAGTGAGALRPIAAVIVVAGGRSTRFGSDKLQHRVAGRTLLERSVAAAATVGPVVLVGADVVPSRVAAAVSEYPRWGGPCAAVVAAVDAVDGDGDLLILPADLARPADAIRALTAHGEGVLTDDGHPQWLLARAGAEWLRSRVARLRATEGGLDGLPASVLLRELPGRFAVAASVCADIDTRADLAAAVRPSPVRIPREEPVHATV